MTRSMKKDQLLKSNNEDIPASDYELSHTNIIINGVTNCHIISSLLQSKLPFQINLVYEQQRIKRSIIQYLKPEIEVMEELHAFMKAINNIKESSIQAYISSSSNRITSDYKKFFSDTSKILAILSRKLIYISIIILPITCNERMIHNFCINIKKYNWTSTVKQINYH